jgi:membrane-associated HD superfamily phosphohydrolase
MVEYFLKKERERVEREGGEVELEMFRYPGMKPGTRETAILMLVDSIEAASRTLDSPDRDRIDEMVRRIVFSKLASGQLDESDLSMKELRVVCLRVAETLVHMNHHRIKYPWQEERAREFGLEAKELASRTHSVYPRAVGSGS